MAGSRVASADEPDVLERLRPDVFALLRSKYFVDEIYEATVIRFNAWWARACDWLDRWVWDGVVQLVSLPGRWACPGSTALFDEYVVNLGFDEGCRGVWRGGGWLSRAAERPRAKLSARHRRGAGGAGAVADLGVQRFMNGFPLLTILTLVPLVGGLVVVGLGAEQTEARARAGAGRSACSRWRSRWLCCGTSSTPRRAACSSRSGTPGFPRWASSIALAWMGSGC